MRDLQEACAAAARSIEAADGLAICAGAGMGVDSGLPDFRGPGGFWQAYPALGRAGIRFEEIASPAAFRRDPELAWGFYGHRLRLYREVAPHAGFGQLAQIADGLPRGGFVFTSNVDGQFQKAGVAESRILECHGSIHYLQCLARCTGRIWPAADFMPEVDAASGRLASPLPRCPECGAAARPAILMFNDPDWADGRCLVQSGRLAGWLKTVARPLAIELGAGTAIATVRRFSQSLGCPLIRINPAESQVPGRRDIALPVGARAGIAGIWEALQRG